MHFLILSGANERAIVAACRNLDADGIGYSIVARPKNDPITHSYLAPRIIASRTLDQLDIDDLCATLHGIRNRLPERLIYLPTSEALNRLVLTHRETLEQYCRLEIPLPSAETYATLSNKASFNELARQYGIKLPPAVTDPENTSAPWVAKPYVEFSPQTGAKLYPILVLNESDRQKFFQKNFVANYFFQKYIDGQSHYYLFFFSPDGHHASLFQENIAQQPGGKSIVAARSCSCPDPDFLQHITDCIRSTGFTGFCMVETMTDGETSYLIELNPRLWGPMDLALRAGFRIAWLGAPEHMKPLSTPSPPLHYAWLTGMLQTRRQGGSLRWYPEQRRSFLRNFGNFLREDIYLGKLQTWPMAWRECTHS